MHLLALSHGVIWYGYNFANDFKYQCRATAPGIIQFEHWLHTLVQTQHIMLLQFGHGNAYKFWSRYSLSGWCSPESYGSIFWSSSHKCMGKIDPKDDRARRLAEMSPRQDTFVIWKQPYLYMALFHTHIISMFDCDWTYRRSQLDSIREPASNFMKE